MNGIVINIDPILVHIGHFELHWYSLMVMLAIGAAILIGVREGKKKGIHADIIYGLASWVVLGGIIGARLLHVIDQWEFYTANPALIIQIQRGGLAIWGALIGGGLATFLYARAKRISLARLFDVSVPAVLTAQIIGRVACIINGDAYGGVTSLPWAFIYTNPNSMIPVDLLGVPTHPYPLYEMLWNGLLLFGLLRFRRYFAREGILFLAYLSFYALGRFLLTFVRQESQFLFGLQQAQIVALLIFLVSLGLVVHLARTKRISEEIA